MSFNSRLRAGRRTALLKVTEESAGIGFQLTGTDSPMMIRARACCCRRRLNHVEATHLLVKVRVKAFQIVGKVLARPSSRCEVARILQRPRMGREEIGVERKDAIGFAEVVDRVDLLSESHHRAGARV